MLPLFAQRPNKRMISTRRETLNSSCKRLFLVLFLVFLTLSIYPQLSPMVEKQNGCSKSMEQTDRLSQQTDKLTKYSVAMPMWIQISLDLYAWTVCDERIVISCDWYIQQKGYWDIPWVILTREKMLRSRFLHLPKLINRTETVLFKANKQTNWPNIQVAMPMWIQISLDLYAWTVYEENCY